MADADTGSNHLVAIAEWSSQLQVLLNVSHAEIMKLGLWFNTKKMAVLGLTGGKDTEHANSGRRTFHHSSVVQVPE